MTKKKTKLNDYLAGWKAIPPKPRRKRKRGKSLFKHGGKPDSAFDSEQLRVGVEVEKEHTDSEGLAKQIAKAHLNERKNYYVLLKRAKL